MKYNAPKMEITKFETVFASGDGKVSVQATPSELGYDVSVSYSEIILVAAQEAESVIKYKK